MKKTIISTIAIILTLIIMLGCISVYAYTVEFNFEDNLISLSVRDTRYKVTLEKFAPYGVVSIERRGLYSFRLILDKHDHQNVLDIISQIRSAEDGNWCTVSPVYYEMPTEPTVEKEYLYKDRFLERYIEPNSMASLHGYDEPYYHTDANGNMDWALIYAYTGPFAESLGSLCFGDRLLKVYNLCTPFTYKYGIYDVKADEFVAIDEFIDYTKYDDLL